MSKKLNGLPIEDVLHIPPNPTGRVTLSAVQLQQIDLSTARSVESLVIKDFPLSGTSVELNPSGSHWKIAVFYSTTPRDENLIRFWNAAVHLSALERKQKLAKRADGVWALRFWTPLCCSGESMIQLIKDGVGTVAIQAAEFLIAVDAQLPFLGSGKAPDKESRIIHLALAMVTNKI